MFQLHSAFDLFNDAMFAEFRSRGLQVQSATPLRWWRSWRCMTSSTPRRTKPIGKSSKLHSQHVECVKIRMACREARQSDRDEDAIRRQMYVGQSAPQGAASVPARLPNEYFCNGVKHLMMPFNPEDIVGDKNVKFNHGDLKFLSMLLQGHELENHPLKFDAGVLDGRGCPPESLSDAHLHEVTIDPIKANRSRM